MSPDSDGVVFIITNCVWLQIVSSYREQGNQNWCFDHAPYLILRDGSGGVWHLAKMRIICPPDGPFWIVGWRHPVLANTTTYLTGSFELKKPAGYLTWTVSKTRCLTVCCERIEWCILPGLSSATIVIDVSKIWVDESEIKSWNSSVDMMRITDAIRCINTVAMIVWVWRGKN